jgi:hypothetical protein
VMPWFRRGGVLLPPWDALMSAFIGLAVALGHSRIRIVRQFISALAPAALVVPALFLLDPDVAQTLEPSESAAAVQTIERTPPIVFVVFDELPLNSLLNAGGDIDAERLLGRRTGFGTQVPSRRLLPMRCLPFCQDDIQRGAVPCRHCETTRSISLRRWHVTTTSLPP